MTSAIISGLVQDIRDSHQECMGGMRVAVQAYWQCGKLLNEAKERHIPKGDFEGWVEANFDFSERTARRYMDFYRTHVAAPLSDLQSLRLTEPSIAQQQETSPNPLAPVKWFDRYRSSPTFGPNEGWRKDPQERAKMKSQYQLLKQWLDELFHEPTFVAGRSGRPRKEY